MARTPSTMLPLGTQMPEFILPNTESTMINSKELPLQKGYLVAFICNHCPFVIHIQDKMTEVFKSIQGLGIYTCAISSNDVVNYPDDSPEKMKEAHQKIGYTFDYLYDETQDTAKQFNAACTPEFYLFDDQKKLVYRGQFDGSRPGNDIEVSGIDLMSTAKQLIANQPISENQLPSLGCNIKWK